MTREGNIRRGRSARAAADPAAAHPWARDAAADGRRQPDNLRRSLAVARTDDDRACLAEQIAAVERRLAAGG